MSLERLDKLISSAFAVSRTDAKALIRAEKVTVNGQMVCEPAYKADSSSRLEVLGREATYQKYVYYMLNKPSGVLSASNDKTRETVVDLVAEKTHRKGLFPVGRLDNDTTGLLIITDDGDFGHKVISPKSNIEKEYIVTVDKAISEADVKKLESGVVLADGTKCRPAKVIVQGEDKRELSIVITEGKYHEIKRMLGTVGAGVVTLHRNRIGGLLLDNKLSVGEFREITVEELKYVLK